MSMEKEYLVSAKEMKQYDTNTIEKIKIPSCVLMERAAYAVAMEAIEYLKNKENSRVLVLSGNGNNGADGVCAARIIKEFGVNASINLLPGEHQPSLELQRQLDIIEYYDVPVFNDSELKPDNYDLIIDALFGIGLNRNIDGIAKEWIESVNNSNTSVISIDIPSGINATDGRLMGCAINANITITFGFYKCGLLLYPGRMHCGKIKKAKIAINETGFFGMKPLMFTWMTNNSENNPGSFRNPMGNKGTFGKVFVIAGRKATTGSALLCASSALRSGCGMVCVLTEQDNKNAFLSVLPEAIIETYTEKEDCGSILEKIKKRLKWADTTVIGCGLGKDDLAYMILKSTIQNTDKSLVCDADALELIAKKEDLIADLRNLAKRQEQNHAAIVFTPHPKELSSLLHCSVKKIKESRLDKINCFTEKYPGILVAKDADTLVCQKENDIYLNVTGNDGLSTAGTGDVLAGLIASFIAQGIKTGSSVFDAVCRSVFVHGKAADILTEENGKSFMIAGDIIQAYKYILK